MSLTILLAAIGFLPPTYVDATTYYPGASYLAGLRALESQFDDLCGDTFCEGDYSNIVSLGLSCSVESSTHRIGACVWAFAGAEPSVDPRSGAVHVEEKTYACDLGASGSADELLSFVQAAAAPPATAFVSRKIPGSSKSAYDALVGCL